MESFLCFESGDSLFLVPLEAVLHIMGGPENGRECVVFEEQEIEVMEFCNTFGMCGRQRARYALLLNHEEKRLGFLVERVDGVYEVDMDKVQELPAETRCEKNALLTGAAWVEAAGRWGFLIDCGQLFERQARDI